MIPYGRQNISQEDIDSVLEVLQSDFLTQGPKIPAFEAKVAEFCGVEHVLAVNSATSALHLACLALGLTEGDWLWTSSISFVASANCGLYCGASVDFVDIDPQTYNISIDALEIKLQAAEKERRLPKVLVVVHMAGRSCEMDRVFALSRRYGFRVIEDASHGIGGRYQGRAIGCCQYSDITVFSFHPVKIITTAEGGVVTTNDAHLAEKMQLLRSHGITRDEALMSKASEGAWYYQQLDLGFNYRMTELQAALGLSQMSRLDLFVKKRDQLAQRYSELLSGEDINLPHCIPDSQSSWHLYIVRLPSEKYSRKKIFDYLRGKGIGVNVHYIPIHLQPYYNRLGFIEGCFPEAEKYYSEAISLPLYYDLSDEDQEYIVSCLHAALNEFDSK